MTQVNNTSAAFLDKLSLKDSQRVHKKELDQNDFLRLMTTQMSNQNPLEPMDNAQFVSQMAQFSSVESLQGLQTSFDNLAGSLSSNQALQASAMVGRNVLVPSKIGYFSGEKPVKMMIDVTDGVAEINSKVNDVLVTVKDESGQIIRTVDLGDLPEGFKEFEWDGKDNSGELAAEGKYSIDVQGRVNNKAETLSTGTYAQVGSVNLGQGTGKIVLNLTGLGSISINDVIEIQ